MVVWLWGLHLGWLHLLRLLLLLLYVTWLARALPTFHLRGILLAASRSVTATVPRWWRVRRCVSLLRFPWLGFLFWRWWSGGGRLGVWLFHPPPLWLLVVVLVQVTMFTLWGGCSAIDWPFDLPSGVIPVTARLYNVCVTFLLNLTRNSSKQQSKMS